MVTIDTISSFGRLIALMTNPVRDVEKTVSNYSAEVRARWECQRTRRQLLKLSDEQLQDIGVTRREADLEGRRPFWD